MFEDWGTYVGIFFGIIVALVLARGIRIVRPTHRLIVERLGKFKTVKKSGITYIIPFIEQGYFVNITEQMTDAEKQMIITQDNLNATVAALVRFKVREDDESVKNSQYQVHDYRSQIVQLARTALRSVIGSKKFGEVNSQRNKLNVELKELIEQEATKWGIEIVSAELKEIDPPNDVQDSMNRVIKANNLKEAAKDEAEAAKTKAEGEKNAAIEAAEGKKRALELEAQGQASAITAVASAEAGKIKTIAEAKAEEITKINKAAEETMTDNARILRLYDVTQAALKDNAKIIITKDGIDPSIIIGEGNVPVVVPQKKKDNNNQ